MIKKIYILVLLCLFSSCDNCLTSIGNIVEIRRNIEDFETVFLYDNISLYLDDDLENEIKIIAGENIQDLLNIYVENTALYLKNTATCNWLRSYGHKIEVHIPSTFIKTIEAWDLANIYTNQQIMMPQFSNLRTYGTGNVDLDVICGSLYVFTNSATSIHLKGSGEDVTLHTNGIGRIEAQRFEINNCKVIHENQNDVLVFPIDLLEVEFRRSAKGQVIYYNEPKELVIKHLGNGRIRKN